MHFFPHSDYFFRLKTLNQLDSNLTVNDSKSEAYRQNHSNHTLLGRMLHFKLV